MSIDPIATTKRILRFLNLDETPAQKFDDAAQQEIMNEAFEGITKRTDRCVGRALDWSILQRQHDAGVVLGRGEYESATMLIFD